jgi:CDGSH-type Zn-finger protein
MEGDCILTDSTGREDAVNGPFALCRCGGSKKKPFCDGTHIKIGFDDSEGK